MENSFSSKFGINRIWENSIENGRFPRRKVDMENQGMEKVLTEERVREIDRARV